MVRERLRSTFNPREKETTKKCLQRRVESLLLFLESTEENITNVINDTTTSPTLKEIERIKEQAMYLRLAYQNALDNMCTGMTEGWTWRECYGDVVYEINNKTGIYRITNGDSIMRWNREYRTEDCFISTTQSKDGSEEPRLFQILSSLKESISI